MEKLNMKYKLMKDKKGVIPATIALVMAAFIGIILLIFLVGGGVSTAWDITKFISDVPTFIWVIFGIIIILKLLGGKKRR